MPPWPRPCLEVALALITLSATVSPAWLGQPILKTEEAHSCVKVNKGLT